MYANDLTKMATWQRNSWELNSRPIELEAIALSSVLIVVVQAFI